MTANTTLQQWLDAINRHDVGMLARLMAPDFMFVDALGGRVNGAPAMERGWRGYFAMCPDYWVRVDGTMWEDDTALMHGEAGGTIDGSTWRVPAAWKAVVDTRHVREFRVYADNKPVYEILARRQTSA
jgi:ketosteroid isomerase-like protein